MPIGGYSFQPMQPQAGGAPMRPPITPQEAVRILSLRLPKNPQNTPIPSALLQAQGGGGVPNLTQLLQMLMRAAGGTAGPGPTGREELNRGPVPAIDHGLAESPRRGDLPPRFVIGDQPASRTPVPEPPVTTPIPGWPTMDDTPLFGGGAPTMRFKAPDYVTPLF